MLRSIFCRTYHHQSFKGQDYIFSAFAANRYFMEAKLKNHINYADFYAVEPIQLKQTLETLFLGKHAAKYIDGLDQGLFKIKELTICTQEQRNAYLQKLNNNQMEKFIPPKVETTAYHFDIDQEISRFTRF